MRFCPFAQRAHLVLEAKSIPYHVTWINLSDKPEWLTQFSQLGKVPALGIPGGAAEPANKTYIHESLMIADYLDEKYPNVPLHPTEPLTKVVDRLLLDRFGAVFGAFYKIAYKDGGENERQEMFTALEAIEEEFQKRGTPFFGGDDPKMVDYMMWPMYERFASLPIIKGADYAVAADRFPGMV